MKTLVLGLGNPLLGDDAVGLRVAAALRGRLPPEVELDEDYCGGLRLMERLAGYERVVIVDALVTGGHPPGLVLCLRPGEIETQHSGSTHDLSLSEALRLAATLGLPMPRLDLVVIEAGKVLEFDEHLTPAVEAAVPRAARMVLELIAAPPSCAGAAA